MLRTLLAPALLALTGCTAAPLDNPLAGTSWRLESLVDGGVPVADVPADELTLDSQERGVRVRSCNSCAGLYAVGDRTLEITRLACTRRACPGRFELDRYVAGRSAWRLEGDRLVLEVDDAVNRIRATLTFVPAQAGGD